MQVDNRSRQNVKPLEQLHELKTIGMLITTEKNKQTIELALTGVIAAYNE